jgi:hypothetical protein
MNDVNRPSLREAARRGAEANRQTKQAAPPKPAPAKPAEVGAAVETVTIAAVCGHTITAVPSGKAAFLSERLKKLAGLPCSECKRKAEQEREAAEQEAARKRREEKAARQPRPKPRLGRLPHGSTFHVVYDAEAVKWSGTLTVPQGGIYNASVTTGEDSAVFALLMKLDRAYRKLPSEDAAPQETPAGVTG